ncbi:hypothetical protein [Idiomarina sp.]|uniref:hypothetical protein n=1 Tax=Idiomarina sp. TaxID=1874361 RepID=UPI0025C2D447|nr:hypothetical protein [Idiomarina sp.]
MPCIRRRYHYGCIYIDDKHPELIGRALVGNRLDVMRKNDESALIPFGGFILDPIQVHSPIKIQHVEAYAHNGYFSGDWLELGSNNVVLGSYVNNTAWIVIRDSIPVAWCDIQ